MDPRLKQKWIKALRSGRYKQTRSALKDTRGYCCLGVLCRVAGARWSERNYHPKLKGEYIGTGEILTEKFLKSIKLSKRQQLVLAGMNDGNMGEKSSSANFKEIADYIEKKL